MIVVDAWRGPFRDHLVFFADGDAVLELARACRPHELFRIRHALAVTRVERARHVGVGYTSCIDLRPDPDAIYHGMDAKSCRYEVRRAAKLGDRLVLRRNDVRSIDDFRPLFNDLIARTRYTRPLTARRYEQYRRFSDVFVAYVDDSPVAGHLVVRDPEAGRTRLVFSVSARFVEGPLRAISAPVNRWLHWQEMLAYREEGYSIYDFGGVNPDSPIGRFKLSFGGGVEQGTNLVLAGALAGPALGLAETALERRRRGRGGRSV